MLEFFCNRAAFDYFLESGGVYVVLDFDSFGTPVFIDQIKPGCKSVEQADVFSEFLELAASEPDAVFFGLIDHKLHI